MDLLNDAQAAQRHSADLIGVVTQAANRYPTEVTDRRGNRRTVYIRDADEGDPIAARKRKQQRAEALEMFQAPQSWIRRWL